MSAAVVTSAGALAALAAGLVLGWLHFHSLRPVSRLLAGGRLSAVLLQASRLAVAGLFLYFCARYGAPQLIAALAGMMAGRAIVLGSADRGAP